MMTLQGSALKAVISPAGVHVNGVAVTQRELVATSGNAHAIDAVVLPQNWQSLAAAA